MKRPAPGRLVASLAKRSMDLLLIFDDSDAKGSKVSEILALRLNEACKKKAKHSKLK